MFKKIMKMIQPYIDEEIIEMYLVEDEHDPFFDKIYSDAYYYITFDDSHEICLDIWQWLQDHATKRTEGLYDIFYYYDDCVISCHWKTGARD